MVTEPASPVGMGRKRALSESSDGGDAKRPRVAEAVHDVSPGSRARDVSPAARAGDATPVLQAPDGAEPPLLRLPPEIIGEIGRRLSTDDLTTTLAALEPLRAAHPVLHVKLLQGMQGLRAAVASQEIAVALYRQAIPAEGFHPVAAPPEDDSYGTWRSPSLSPSPAPASPRSPGTGRDSSPAPGEAAPQDAGGEADPSHPAFAPRRIDAIGPILHLLPEAQRAELATRILDIAYRPAAPEAGAERPAMPSAVFAALPDDERSRRIDFLPHQVATIAATAPFIETFPREDRSRLFDGVVTAIHHVDLNDIERDRDVWHSGKSFIEASWSSMRPEDHDKVFGTEDEQTGEQRIPPLTFNNRWVSEELNFPPDREAPGRDLPEAASPPASPLRSPSPLSRDATPAPDGDDERAASLAPSAPPPAARRPLDALARDYRAPPDTDRQAPPGTSALRDDAQALAGHANDARQSLLNRDRGAERSRSPAGR